MLGTPAPNPAPPRGATLHLMLTCLCDAFYPQAGIATVACLEHLGYRVKFNAAQTCCAQPAFNSGDRPAARTVARHTLDTFADAQHIVVPSGSCAAMLRWGYPQLFEGEPDLDAATRIGTRTWELSELLTRATAGRWPGRYARKLAFHRSCHTRELSPEAQPEALLASIEGVELIPLQTAEQCCGFGGTFSTTFTDISADMATHKWLDLAATGAEEIATGDMGCLMHLDGFRRKHAEAHPTVPFRHYAEILNDSLKDARPDAR